MWFFLFYSTIYLAWSNKIFYWIIPKKWQDQPITHTHTQHTIHNTQYQDEPLPSYPQQLCPISPWQHLPWPQIMVPRLPTSLLQAPGSGFTLTVAGSLGWDSKLICIKKKREGWGLGLRWPLFGHKTQQSTNKWWQWWQWEGWWRGCTARVEHVSLSVNLGYIAYFHNKKQLELWHFLFKKQPISTPKTNYSWRMLRVSAFQWYWGLGVAGRVFLTKKASVQNEWGYDFMEFYGANNIQPFFAIRNSWTNSYKHFYVNRKWPELLLYVTSYDLFCFFLWQDMISPT